MSLHNKDKLNIADNLLKIKTLVKKRVEINKTVGDNDIMHLSHNNSTKKDAFTLIELIIILVIMSILVTLAVPEVLNARKDTRALMCGASLKQIEVAKSAWAREFPGAPIPNQDALNRYFPNGMFPKDPWGQQFQNVTTLNQEASHPYNGIAAYEPRGADPTKDANSNNIADILENGRNDLGTP